VPAAPFEALPGVTNVVAENHTIRLQIAGPVGPVLKAAAGHELVDVVSREPNLEEVFLAQYGRDGDRTATPSLAGGVDER
jgi:ABC-2 type transport system ATP-binding protein